MFEATIAVSVLLAALLAFAALRKLSHRPEVVETYTRVGVPEEKLDYLAWILLAGAAGVLLGLFWVPIGIAAGAGLVVYFLLAIAAHVRAADLEHVATPVVVELLSAAALVGRIATV
jgi:hypothetical protein